MLEIGLNSVRSASSKTSYIRGTQRPNVSKNARSVSDGFLYPLGACLFNLKLLLKTIYLFGCLRHESFRWLFRFLRKC